ncbi:MAG: hypothetical protein K0S28_269 [Paucimonas sp.]|jgi:hypothetical protein|nr:hypothetical protein [Paucimonas sp.]
MNMLPALVPHLALPPPLPALLSLTLITSVAWIFKPLLKGVCRATVLLLKQTFL